MDDKIVVRKNPHQASFLYLAAWLLLKDGVIESQDLEVFSETVKNTIKRVQG